MTETKPREASPQERVKIRSILDKHFDDGAGQWLDGYSDQRAGEEIGVPWALVTRIREAAYGPIRVDPEIGAIRAELIQIGRDLAAMTERHAAAQKRLDALLAKRAQRVVALEINPALAAMARAICACGWPVPSITAVRKLW